MSFTVHILPSGYTFSVRANETVLAGALRQGYQIPFSCAQAICGTCKGHLVEGKVHYNNEIYAITDEEREMGAVLLCSAIALSDLVVTIEGVVGPHVFPVRRLSLAVEHFHEVSRHILQVFLKQPEETFAYAAGQYVEILHLDESPFPFSIANSPNAKLIEFHIRHLPHHDFTAHLVHEIKTKKMLRLIGPYGAMRYQREPHYPLLFIAGGTGFAPFKAILEHAIRDPHHQPIYLYWGAKTREDLYWHEQCEKWAQTVKNFHYTPVLSQASNKDHWQGETGLVHEVVLKNHANFLHFHVYASGPPEMVFAAQKAFLLKGLSKARFYSDMLDYQPK